MIFKMACKTMIVPYREFDLSGIVMVLAKRRKYRIPIVEMVTLRKRVIVFFRNMSFQIHTSNQIQTCPRKRGGHW